MTSYSPRGLGEVVQRERKSQGWTQEKLGQEAGYDRGAGVAISRVESGRLPPNPERFERIAEALGLSADELAQRAEDETKRLASDTHGGGESIEDRDVRVQREIEYRTNLVTDLEQAFNDAHDRAKDDFLMRLVEIAARLEGAPPELRKPIVDDIPERDDADAEAKYEIQFRRFGVAQALADAGARVAEGDAGTYPSVTAAVAGGTVAARGMSPTSVAATNAFVAALNLRKPDARRTAVAEAATFVGIAVAQAAWGLVRAKRQRNREQLQEISAKLDVAEAGLDQTKRNVEALRGLMPRATEILEHISVHAARALDRWEAQLGQGPRDFDSLGEAELHRYQDFVEIAAAQYAVAAIDFENLLKSRDDELSRGIAHADKILAQARNLIWSRV